MAPRKLSDEARHALEERFPGKPQLIEALELQLDLWDFHREVGEVHASAEWIDLVASAKELYARVHLLFRKHGGFRSVLEIEKLYKPGLLNEKQMDRPELFLCFYHVLESFFNDFPELPKDRGRPREWERDLLASSIAFALDAAGIKLTKSGRGALAFTISIMSAEVGLHNIQDLFPVVARAVEQHRRAPLLPLNTKEAEKEDADHSTAPRQASQTSETPVPIGQSSAGMDRYRNTLISTYSKKHRRPL